MTDDMVGWMLEHNHKVGDTCKNSRKGDKDEGRNADEDEHISHVCHCDRLQAFLSLLPQCFSVSMHAQHYKWPLSFTRVRKKTKSKAGKGKKKGKGKVKKGSKDRGKEKNTSKLIHSGGTGSAKTASSSPSPNAQTFLPPMGEEKKAPEMALDDSHQHLYNQATLAVCTLLDRALLLSSSQSPVSSTTTAVSVSASSASPSAPPSSSSSSVFQLVQDFLWGNFCHPHPLVAQVRA